MKKDLLIQYGKGSEAPQKNYIEGGGLQDKLDNISSKLTGDHLKLSSEKLSITSDRHRENIFILYTIISEV